MIERAVPIVENSDAIPQLGILLWIWEEIESLLISGICFLEIILH